MQPKEKKMTIEVPGKPWDTTGTDKFTLNSMNYLYIVGYYSNFLTV